jgi:hypothetical protein
MPRSIQGEKNERDRSARDHDAKRRSLRDIGPLGVCENEDRRKACGESLRLFLDTYGRLAFPLPWSDDHLRSIANLERAIKNGGLFAWAMPRGSGKTTMLIFAVLWAILYGHRRFVSIIGATTVDAESILESVKVELTHNEILLADFKVPCQFFNALQDDAKKAKGQLLDDEPTGIVYKKTKLVMPTVRGHPHNESSGAVITVRGLTGSLRGQKHSMNDGTILRPDFAVLDDPQTNESAMSPSQSQRREKIIAGDVLGMAGPSKTISAVMPCTVIRAGDMADRLLNRKEHPSWQGERFKMVYAWPKNERLWEQYATLRTNSLINDGSGEEATEFYRQNQAAMDDGAKVAWEHRKFKNELSAIQHAVNLRLRDPAAFDAEYQNEPLPEDKNIGSKVCSAEMVRAKATGLPRGIVPLSMQTLTSFVDVQQDVLFWMVCAWAENGSGHVVDYGMYPDQGLNYITLSKVKRTLRQVHQASTVEGGIRAGLDALWLQLNGRTWRREDGGELRLTRKLVDRGKWPEPIIEFCKRSPHDVMPSRGIGIGAANKPMEEYNKKPGEKIGHHWMVGFSQKHMTRELNIDTNYWKTWVHERMSLGIGELGGLTLFGTKSDHLMLSDHMVAESCVKTEGRERTVYQWIQLPGEENHLLDCAVGCAAAANEQGIRADPGALSVNRIPPSRRRLRTAEQFAGKR